MLFISDRSAVQAFSKWKILNKDIVNNKKELTYFSPGGYSFKDKHGRIICFDWCDSCAEKVFQEDRFVGLEATQYSLDHDFITSSLEEDDNNELIQEKYRLELFKDFVKFDELHCTIDIDKEEVNYENNIECVYFELYDPISEESIILLDKVNE